MVRALARTLVAVLLALLAGGCSSAPKEYNPKMGLLDELLTLAPANSSGSHDRLARLQNPRALQLSNAKQSVVLANGLNLQWPLRNVQITSRYGWRGREFHEGVDLRAKVGTPVYAAHEGQVLYANDRLKGYGKMIVIRHASGIATIYAHNSRLLVHSGQYVKRGELISYSGNTGHSHGPHLHFEVRQGVNTVDPVRVMGRVRLSRAARSPSGRSASRSVIAMQALTQRDRPLSGSAKIASSNSLK